jgi:NADH:ubiquinone oxidoreductase subunit C
MELYLFNSIPRFIFYIYRKKYHQYIISDSEYLSKLLIFLYLNLNLQSKSFVDLIAIDILKNNNRFILVYQILSHIFTNRFFIKIITNELDKIESQNFIFPNISWYEREVWDLFGINFIGNSDMRRILTDYGFDGHPLRKDFPLSGFIEVSYSERIKNIKYSSVSFIQEFRFFDTKSPWDFFNVF